jgi:alanyl aminopeptidase
MPRRLVAPTLLAIAACAPEAAPPPSIVPRSVVRQLAPVERVPDAPEPRDDGRLPDLAAPVRYALSLRLDPVEARYTGVATILVDVKQPTYHVVLHGRDLHVSRVVARNGREVVEGSASTRASHESRFRDELVLTFCCPLPAGQVELEIAYDAPFGSDLRGLYRVREDGRWYAFSKFEPIDARRAFPCFDEPKFKTPFDVTIAVPRGAVALSNAPESARQDNGGTVSFRFATTPPLPTYLVAFAAGELEVRAGPKSPVPIRVVAAKGKSQLGELALEASAELTARLGRYFGVAYPYSKLDLVAVPDFASGAMENPGLITFREELLLLDPSRASTSARRNMAGVMAHELAHQWFGNLVTAEWWNELWLNEGMATWMERHALDDWQPKWGASLDAVGAGLGVMDADARVSARRVRQPVASGDDAMVAFDGITYQKGAALLGMLEQWVGAPAFQRGVRDYVSAHAWKSATADDLLGAVAAASGKDVRGVASPYLDQTGVPLVDAQLVCEPKDRWHVELSQEPWRPVGAASQGAQKVWQIPVCVRADGQKDAACAVLAAGAPALVAGKGPCPRWIHPNARSAGYYRYALAPRALGALANAAPALDPSERVSVIGNMWAQARAGRLDVDVALKTLPAFDRETDRRVVDQVVAALTSASDAVVEDSARPAFRAYVAARLGPHKKRLGWAPGTGSRADEDERSLLRANVLRAMAELADDDATIAEADARAAAWLKDPASVHPDVAHVALEIASRKAGADRHDALRALLGATRAPQDRVAALRALGSFDDKALLEKSLGMILGGEVRLQDLRYLFGAAMSHRATRPVTVAWVRAHWDELRAKLPGVMATRLVWIAATPCTTRERDEMEAFIRPRAKTLEAAARPLEEALEASSLCAALRAHGAAATTRFLTAKK